METTDEDTSTTSRTRRPCGCLIAFLVALMFLYAAAIFTIGLLSANVANTTPSEFANIPEPVQFTVSERNDSSVADPLRVIVQICRSSATSKNCSPFYSLTVLVAYCFGRKFRNFI